MKIALVFPRYKYPSGDPPLGIAYIAAYLKENSGCRVELIDTTFNTSSEYINSVFKHNDYDIIGISSMTSMIDDAIKVAEIAKANNPNSLVIAGGPHPSVLPNETLQNKNIDAVCIGEGESTFLEIVRNNGNLEGVKGVWFKKNGNILKNPGREPIGELDTLPFPARDLLPMNKYFKNWFQLDSVDPNLVGTSIISSRGCPYNCTYCQPTLMTLFGNKIRKRSPENILQEITYLREKYNINAFMFQDDTFIIDKKWALEICDRILDNGLDLKWGCNVRANLVSKDLLTRMKAAGLRKIFMGIESASQRILDDIYNKRITIEHVKRTVEIAKELELKVQGYFMLGAPTETVDEIKRTIKFAKTLDIDEATFSITTPLPRTYLYDKIKELIVKDYGLFDYYKTPVFRNTTGATPEEVVRLKKRAYLEFYLMPKRMLSTITSFFTLRGYKKSLNKLKRL